jgi:FAD/FMN-containing dehydrogenase
MTTETVAPPPLALDEFASRLRGGLIRPTDATYDERRRVWNAMIDKRPLCIAGAASAADVIAAVTFAREHDLPLSIRGGGHSASGAAVAHDGLMLDLSGMKGIRVDPPRRTVRAEAGVLWTEFDRETQAFGLATTGGVMSTTGIAGLTLGGGVGWLMRTHGLACDNLLSVDIVTADGQLRSVNADEHPDLFWALRGGGGNFGVVTSFEYRLHPVGPTVLGGALIWPRSQAREVFQLYREFTDTAPEHASGYFALGTLPDGAPVVLVVAFSHGPMAEAQQVFKPLRSFGPPLADVVQPVPYTAFQCSLDELNAAGNRVYWKSAMLPRLSESVLDVMLDHTARTPSPLSATVIEFYGGAANRIGVEDTAYPHRGVDYALNILTYWRDVADDQVNIEWARRLFDAVTPFSNGGVYVNFTGVGDTTEDRVRAAYGRNYQRLAQIKAKYDPTNLFRINQNIRPAL